MWCSWMDVGLSGVRKANLFCHLYSHFLGVECVPSFSSFPTPFCLPPARQGSDIPSPANHLQQQFSRSIHIISGIFCQYLFIDFVIFVSSIFKNFGKRIENFVVGNQGSDYGPTGREDDVIKLIVVKEPKNIVDEKTTFIKDDFYQSLFGEHFRKLGVNPLKTVTFQIVQHLTPSPHWKLLLKTSLI